MKKTLSIILFLCFISIYSYADSIDINGIQKEIDTIEYKQVGPGVTYCYAKLPQYPQDIHILTIDLDNKYTEIETFLGNDKLNEPELVTHACDRLTREGHDAYCGINSDFFILASDNVLPYGCPVGACAQNGMIQYAPRSSWWSVAVMDTAKKVYFDYMYFEGKMKLDDGKELKFLHANVAKSDAQLTFYNRYAGPTTPGYRANAELSKEQRTEVVVLPVEGDKWGINKTTRVKVVRIVNNVNGGEPISGNEGVLSGIRDAAKFLDNIKEGQEFDVEMALPFCGGMRNQIMQMVGGNAVLMKDGVLTERNTSDNYNSQSYPRTIIATSKDKRWLYLFTCDGKHVGGSVGLSTTDCCGILKNLGAWDIMGCDGGGSAEMIVNHKVANKPADGIERRVGDGWLVVSTAPTDNEIVSLRFHNHNIRVPKFADYKPVVLGYNKYGALVNQDVKGFTLSCDHNIGICDGEVFTAAGSVAKGNIKVSYNNIEFTAPLSVVDAQSAIRLDSVIVDQDIDYEIEVESKAGKNVMLINPSKLHWTIEDEDIAAISEDGVLNGKTNGRTMLRCTLGDFNDSILVISEINEPKMIADDFKSAKSDWKIKSASAKWNARFDDIDNSRIIFDYSASRIPYIQLSRNLRLHSIPDSIGIKFNSTVGLKSINVSIDYPVAKQPVIVIFDKELNKDEEHEIIIKSSDVVENPGDLVNYPFTFKYIKFNINPAEAAKGQNVIDFNDIVLYFNYENISTEVDAATAECFSVWPNPASESVTVDCKDGGLIEVYDLAGRAVLSRTVADGESVNVSALAPGSYIVKLGNKTAKLIIK